EVYNPSSNSWSPTGVLRTARAAHAAALLPDGRVLVAGGKVSANSPLASAELYDPSTGAWSATGGLATARFSHTATVLLDGRVLVAGGIGAGGAPLASAELYDPPLGARWAATDGLDQPRSAHTGTLLPNGEVLVAGGHTTFDGNYTFNIAPLASAERYRPASGTWAPTGALVRARSFHTATLLAGTAAQCGANCGKVLVVGGLGRVPGETYAESLRSAELYDPATGQWRATNPMTVSERYWHTATRLRDGRVLVVAGADNAGNPLASAEIFNPATESWTPAGALSGATSPPASNTPPGARVEHTATLLDREPCGDNCGKVLVAGGVGGLGAGPSLASAELYDPATGSWTATDSLGQSRQLHADALLPSGKVLVSGGFHIPFSDFPPNLDTGELYDPVTEEWRPTGFMRSRRIYHTATVLADGTVLAAGGSAGGNARGFPNVPGPALASSERYTPATNGWSASQFMNVARVVHTATRLPDGPATVCGANCGKVLVAGGDREIIASFPPYFDYKSPISSAELYTPSTSASRPVARPPGGAEPAAPFADCPSLTANVIRGTAASNSITGTPRGDRIFAGTGDDTVDGLAGNDCIDLGPGTDRGQGGSGADLLLGGLGKDRMSGSS
ncbi:MAG: hypothetical protein LC790_02990, partial [Actinobacteria bacterium]|nr:hypothetical protein [Actinomycetota bacterium]